MNSLAHTLPGLPRIPLSPWTHQVLAAARRRASKHRRALAIGGSVGLHLLLILALLSSPSPRGLAGGGSGGTTSGAGTGETYAAVDLIPALPAPATAVKTLADPQAEALDTPPDTIKPQTDTLTTDSALPQLAATEASPGGAGQAGATSGAGDDLWGAIAPCWKQVAGADTLPVALKITFAANGGLAKPPEIVRDGTAAITPQSLRSEAQALQALAQCGAYPMAANRQDVEVHFPKPN